MTTEFSYAQWEADIHKLERDRAWITRYCKDKDTRTHKTIEHFIDVVLLIMNNGPKRKETTWHEDTLWNLKILTHDGKYPTLFDVFDGNTIWINVEDW